MAHNVDGVLLGLQACGEEVPISHVLAVVNTEIQKQRGVRMDMKGPGSLLHELWWARPEAGQLGTHSFSLLRHREGNMSVTQTPKELMDVGDTTRVHIHTSLRSHS